MAGALSGIRVLDLSRVLAGPWSTQILADLGAEVIKIERPGVGDETRAWGPPYQKDDDGLETTESAYYLCANRNKKSVTLDIASRQAGDILRQLASQCDVLVENFKVGGLKRYGLDYESVKQIAPRIVYCSITGFGQTGPYAPRPGYDFLIQAAGGLMSVTGRADGEQGAGPVKAGVAVADILTGLYATIGILAALRSRDQTGVGQHIDMSLLDVQVACMANQATNFFMSGEPPRRLGNGHPNVVPYQDFVTSDGAIILAIGNDSQFRKFCTVSGHPELGSDPRYAKNTARLENYPALLVILRKIMLERSSLQWIELLSEAGVPCGPINDLAQVFADPQVQARELRLDLPHKFGVASSVANPIRLSETPVEYRRGPPTLGEHTQEVLQNWLKLSEGQIAELRREGVI
ncbi:MAG: CaiB/BaiF CoA transferase family protein [Steroidobacterales bacterium]